MPRTSSKFSASQALQLAYAQAATVKAKNSQLAQSLGISRPLAIHLLWPMKENPSKHKATKI